ncbi:MAG TPA: ATP-binding protein [Chitinivibrionales bacterium]|jgi:PAS domain S-box-containing protein|nr:ATP-binding protein [Chitinivibrionales bacterium]
METNNISPRFPFFAAALFVLLLAAIFVTAWYYYRFQERRVVSAVQDELSAVANLKTEQIGAWRRNRLGDAQILSRRALVFTENGARKSLLDYVRSMGPILAAYKEEYGYRSMIVTDTTGRVVNDMGGTATARVYLDTVAIRQVVAERKMRFVDFYRCPGCSRTRLDLLAPLLGPDTAGAVAGVLVLVCAPENFLYPLVQTWPVPSRTAETLLLQHDGRTIVYLNELRHRKGSALRLRISVNAQGLAAAEIARGGEGLIEGMDYRGVEVFAVGRHVPDSPWYIEAKVDKEEVFAPLRAVGRTTVLVVGLVIIVVGSLIVSWWMTRERRIFKKQYLAEAGLRQAQEGLKQSEEKYRSLVDSVDDAILVVQEGTIKFLNRRAVEVAGFSSEELMGKPFLGFIHPDDRQMVMDNYVKRMKGERVPSRYEFRLGSVGGSEKWVEIGAIRIDWNGRPATLNFLTDTTERRHLEKEKERLESQLRQAQKMEAIGTLAGGVAHDFNNLLSIISGYTALALEKTAESDPLHADLTQVGNAAEKAGGVVRQLLLFGRKHPILLQPVNLNNTVKSLVKMLERVIGENITVQFDAGKELWPLEGDEGTIEQVIMNLAVNARDAMPDGGKLTIRTENAAVDQEYCRQHSAGRPGRFVCLVLSDSGTGMDELIQEHIFEPFFTTKAAGKGTGLGLSVVLGIVQQHKGWIEVQSEPGKGTTFEVYFPSTSETPREKTREETLAGSLKGNGERIMLVEDHDEVRLLANEILTANGYAVLAASSAKDALALFEKENGKFNLIFSDVGLPDKSGVWLVEELLKHGKIPVLFCSGYTDEKSNWDYMKSKNIRFLRKPYSIPDLLAAVKEVLGQNNRVET